MMKRERLNSMKYFSLFTGIGGFDLPLKELGFECVGWSEIDKYACKTFEVNFPELAGLNYGDITKINCSEMPDFDLLVGGSPCQSFSISKKDRNGLQGISGLFEEYLRILKEKQPDNFIWENVKGVLSCSQGEDWKYIITSFQEAGYKIKYKVLSTKDYEIPQNRERVFIVGQREDLGEFQFVFPAKRKLKVFLKDIIESGYTDRGTSYCIDHNYEKTSATNPRAYFEDSKRQIIFTDKDKIKFRKLTPLECFRLQGFPDDFCHRAKEAGISNTQLYKQAGNAVTTNVVKAILESLYFDNIKKKQMCLF